MSRPAVQSRASSLSWSRRAEGLVLGPTVNVHKYYLLQQNKHTIPYWFLPCGCEQNITGSLCSWGYMVFRVTFLGLHYRFFRSACSTALIWEKKRTYALTCDAHRQPEFESFPVPLPYCFLLSLHLPCNENWRMSVGFNAWEIIYLW